TVLLGAAAAFVAGLGIMGTLGGSFFPVYDRGEFQVSFKSAPQSSIDETENRMEKITSLLLSMPEVDHIYGTIGSNDTTVRDGSVYVKLKEKKDRPGRGEQEVMQDLREKLALIPGIEFALGEAGSFHGQKSLMANLRGDDIEVLKKYAAEIKRELYKIEGLADLEVSMEQDTPEMRISVDRERAADAGLNTGVVVRTVGAMVGGQVVSTYEDEDGNAVDVRVRLPEKMRADMAQVENLRVSVPARTPGGAPGMLPLGEFIRHEMKATPSQIDRGDLSRQVVISANPQGIPLKEAADKIMEVANKINLPPGYRIVFTGEAADMEESNKYMGEALLLAVIFVYLILAAQFESFIDPLAIMLSLPLSLVGMAGMLRITGDTINIMSLIGLIMLMGLVTKNAILLVDYAKVLIREHGMERREALITAGRTRLRPIIMTTAAMVFGMLPLALALGAGAEMRAPMARAVIGGLITSTLLTLIVVPVVYSLLDDFGRWVHRRWVGEGKPHHS
ncbi:MAG TPA: efflux RND transporter permease subunit, partial [Geobacteraceae bacterium]